MAQATATHAADSAIPLRGLHRPLPAEMVVDSRNLGGLDERAYARMSPDDPLLHLAWWHLLGGMLPHYGDEPTPRAALADLRRRGDSATPILLKLMSDNRDSDFECCAFSAINLAHLNPQPFLDYAQQMLRERTLSSYSENALRAVMVLLEHGEKADRDLVEWYALARPYLGPDIRLEMWSHDQSRGIKYPQPRVEDTPVATVVLPPPPPPHRKPLPPRNEGSKTGVVAIIWLIVGVIALAFVWLAMKRRK